MKLYIIRHGETDSNANGIVQGWLDTELNEKGLAQAVEAAKQFDKPIDAIYSSDLKRATQTALELRKKYPTVPYIEDARLRERNFGDAAGTRISNRDWEQLWSLNDSSTIPNAETLNDFSERVKSFLDELRTKPYTSVLVVAHGGVLNQVQSTLYVDHQHYSHANASVLEVDI